MIKLYPTTLTVALTAIALPAFSANGHYVPGVEGIGGAAVPPPGIYYRGSFVHYDIENLRDGGGSKAPGNNTGEVTALANRFIWITDKKIFGANYGAELILTLQDTSLKFEGLGVKDSDSGLGDIYFAPVLLAWHGQQWDAVFEGGYWFDTADYEPAEPASVGKGFNTTMFTLGGSWHFDVDKRWSISALSRYEIKTRQDETLVTPGDSWLVEWSLSHRLANGVEVGLVGYDAWQLERDQGRASDKAEKHAAGIETGYFWPQIGLGLNGAYYNEYNNEAGAEGDLYRITLTKVF